MYPTENISGRFIGMRMTFFLLSAILVVYVLVMARNFLYPIAFGVMISYLLYPIVNFLEKRGFPRIFAILFTLAIAFAAFVILAIFILKRISLFMDELPYFREKTIGHIEVFQKAIETHMNIPAERFKNFLLNRLFDMGSQSEKVFTTTTGTLFVILMQPVYVFLFLYYRTKFAYFILKMAGRRNRQITVAVLREISRVVTRYMLGVTTVVLILCFLNPIGYLIIGIQYPLLLGVLSALFSFIPYFGNFIGGSIPFLFALLTEDHYRYALRVALFVYLIHFIENNLLSPNIVGNNIRINPFVIILGLIGGTMIWGLPGMLVTIPFLAMFNIVLKNIPGMQAYAYLLGTRGTRRHALNGQNIRRFAEIIARKIRK